jgi:hypothetical protein
MTIKFKNIIYLTYILKRGTNMRTLSDLDKKILAKLAPELEGTTGPAPGHDYKFILLPVSHKISESPEDFGERINKLTDDELEYIVDMILQGEEDSRSLAEGDYDALVEVIEKRLPEKAVKLKSELPPTNRRLF